MSIQEKTKRKVTMQEVALLAGVSRSTVSRVINNATISNIERTMRVRQAMNELNYAPPSVLNRQGPRIKKRKKYRSKQIAVLSFREKAILDSPIYNKLLHGISEELENDSYNMCLNFQSGPNTWKTIPKNIDGIILFKAENIDSAFLRHLKHIPSVCVFGSPASNPFIDHITYDDEAVGRKAAEFLIKTRKRKKLLYLYYTKLSRFDSFQQYAGDHGVDVVGFDLNKQNSVDSLVMQDFVKKIANMPERPDGIFAGNDRLIPPLHYILGHKHFGFEPGENIDLIGVDNIGLYLDGLSPRPATVDIHAEKVGALAVKQLMWRINNPREPRVITQLEPEVLYNDINNK